MLQSLRMFGGICSKPSKKKKKKKKKKKEKLASVGKMACDVLLCHSLKG